MLLQLLRLLKGDIPEDLHLQRRFINRWDLGQSDETPQANKTTRKSRTPQGRYSRGDLGQSDETPQANKTTHQPRTPQARCSQERQDNFPMSDKKFQRKVLLLLVEIKEELRRIGRRVEPDTDFHLSTMATEEEFQNLEKQLESQRTQAAMVCKLCQIGGRNLKDSARRMLDSVSGLCSSRHEDSGVGQEKDDGVYIPIDTLGKLNIETHVCKFVFIYQKIALYG
nr:uncharacterized protein LOC129437414 [Misgurnus anguillicaudatus]